MTILFDIGHPAHVHYFKNAIRTLQHLEHDIVITARERVGIQYLLQYYGFSFISRGKGGDGLQGKLFYLPKAIIQLLKVCKSTKPDIFVSFSSPYAAVCAFILRKPHYCFDDTEHAFFEHLLCVPFSKFFLTPLDFRKDFGKKHLRFNGSMDYAYLHPNYYKPDISIFQYLGLQRGEPFILVRFVNWEASHDFGQRGLNLNEKIEAIDILSRYRRVFISSECELPDQLKKHKVLIPFEKMHDALYFADLFFGESGTMATEACVLGTPAINIATSALLVGVFDQFVEIGLLKIFKDFESAILEAEDILSNKGKINYKEVAVNLSKGKTDICRFLIDLVNNEDTVSKDIQNEKYQFN